MSSRLHASASHAVGLAVFGRAQAADHDLAVRAFCPADGIPEDPVTGSIHSTLVPYWAGQLGRTELLAYQASPRGGWLECELAGDRVMLTGQAVTFMQARIFLHGAG